MYITQAVPLIESIYGSSLRLIKIVEYLEAYIRLKVHSPCIGILTDNSLIHSYVVYDSYEWQNHDKTSVTWGKINK